MIDFIVMSLLYIIAVVVIILIIGATIGVVWAIAERVKIWINSDIYEKVKRK